MTRHFSPIVWLALVLLLVPFPASALTDDAAAPDGNPTGGNRHRWSDRTAVAAALEAPDEGAAWGRVMYFTHEYPYGTMTELKCHVVDLEPGEYTLFFYGAEVEGVEADGVEVGPISTDEFGEGWLKLQSRVADDGETSIRNYDPIPEGVPAVLEVMTAKVFPAGVEGADPVLVGDFIALPEAPSGAVQPVYLERIRLYPVGDLEGARGIARVTRDVDGYQYFSTSAAGLEPSSSYRIEVDGNLAGTVSTNPCGHAELELSDHPGLEDQIPEPLGDVELMRIVQWYDADEDGSPPVLEGSFTGTNQVDVDQATGGQRQWNNRRGCDGDDCGGGGGGGGDNGGGGGSGGGGGGGGGGN